MAEYKVTRRYSDDDTFQSEAQLEVTLTKEDVADLYTELAGLVDINDSYPVVEFMLKVRKFYETETV